jgi:hypothetical protein
VLSIDDYERMRGAARRRLLETIEQTHDEAAAAGMTDEVLDQLLDNES